MTDPTRRDVLKAAAVMPLASLAVLWPPGAKDRVLLANFSTRLVKLDGMSDEAWSALLDSFEDERIKPLADAWIRHVQETGRIPETMTFVDGLPIACS
jgi:hypothetical protein